MTALKWIVLAVCTLWALGGLIVVLGYGLSLLGMLGDFGPLALALLWLVATRRNSS